MVKHLLYTFLLVVAFCLGAQAQPVNDQCDEAEVLPGAGMYNFSTIGASTDGPDHPTNCPSIGATGAATYKDVWYSFTPNWTGFAIFTLCGTANFDSKIIVYQAGAACPVQDGQVLACNDDGGGCANSTSEIIFPVVAGETYLLRLGGWGDGPPGLEGMGTFIVEEYIFNGPANDNCANAIEIFMDSDDSITVNFSTVDAMNDSPEHIFQDCFASATENFVFANVWFKWTATFTGAVDLSTCGTVDYDSRLAVYGPGATCPPSTDLLVACSDDGLDENFLACSDYTSRDVFSVVEGGTYLISLGGWSTGDSGDGYFSFKKTDPYIPPANDNCSDAEDVYIISAAQADNFDVIFTGNNQTASYTDSIPYPTCRPTGEFWDVWYSFNSGNNTDLELRFKIEEPAESDFIIDLFSDCGTVDASPAAFCFRTDEPGTSSFITYPLPNFPGTPTDYLMRISSRIASNLPGNYWFQIVGEPSTNVEEPALTGFRLFPNPANDLVSIDFGLTESARGHWELLNLLGQPMFASGEVQFAAGQNRLNHPMAKLPAGVYFFKLVLDGKEKTVRFAKQ